MKIDFWTNKINYFGKCYTILTPISPLSNTYITCTDTQTFFWYGDKKDLMILSGLCVLAFQEKDIILYLPTKQNQFSKFLEERYERKSGLDLLLVYHSIQFKHKIWKQIRNRLKYDIKVSYDVNEFEFKDLKWEDIRRYYYHENKDVLDIKFQYETLFMVGSPRVFGSMASCFLTLAENGEESFQTYEHEHLDRYLRGKNNNSEIVVYFYDQTKWID